MEFRSIWKPLVPGSIERLMEENEDIMIECNSYEKRASAIREKKLWEEDIPFEDKKEISEGYKMLAGMRDEFGEMLVSYKENNRFINRFMDYALISAIPVFGTIALSDERNYMSFGSATAVAIAIRYLVYNSFNQLKKTGEGLRDKSKRELERLTAEHPSD